MKAPARAFLLVVGIVWWSIGPVGAATSTVRVVNNAFEPSQTAVQAGDSVVWEFAGATAPHSVTADDGSFDSHPQCSGSNIPGCSNAASSPYSRVFDTPGTYRYYCKIHGGKGGSGMAGTVVVADTAPAPTTAASSPTTAAHVESTSPPTTRRQDGATTMQAASPAPSLPVASSTAPPQVTEAVSPTSSTAAPTTASSSPPTSSSPGRAREVAASPDGARGVGPWGIVGLIALLVALGAGTATARQRMTASRGQSAEGRGGG